MKTMDVKRFTANHRAEFARQRYIELITAWSGQDTIAGYRARKIGQAYKVYCHYLEVFNGSKPNHPSFCNRTDIWLERKKRADKRENAIRKASNQNN